MLKKKLKRFFKKTPKWFDFAFEFVILFLAVFFGFMAENYREYKQDKAQEQRYIVELINDTKFNISHSKDVIDDFNERIVGFDSLANNFEVTLNGKYAILNHTAWSRGSWMDYFPNEFTLNQLQSGGFKLIENQKVINKIVEYKNQHDDLLNESNNTLSDHWHIMLECEGQLINYYLKDSLMRSGTNINNVATRGLFIRNDQRLINDFYRNFSVVHSNLKAMIQLHKKQINIGKDLINLLKKEYNIEE